MRLFFSILSLAYISSIFLFAQSPIVRSLSPFNPYSLLHIPLYGILTILLVFSFFPLKRGLSKGRLLIPALVAFGVAVIDEIHQTYLPYRNGSLSDVFLDFLGILLALFFIHKIFKMKFSPTAPNFTKHVRN